MTMRRYTLPVEEPKGHLPEVGGTVTFDWDYDDGRDRLLTLYEKGKNRQWNASTHIDWSLEVDLEDQGVLPDYYVPICGSPVWEAMTRAEKDVVRHHYGAWVISQFLHGEQGALICASKIVQTVPDIDSKFYAATQVMDEARHVEAFGRYLNEKIDLAYPINTHLAALLE